MGKAHIDVYARIRPTKKPSPHVQIDYADHAIAVHIPKHDQGLINNQRENYQFAFTRVLDQSITQEAVFETVAQPVVDSVIEGYNGTVFAYGQTGSGKTFTITGGAERYVDRGIIPRTLSYIFGKIAEKADTAYEVRVSYLEIYNEAGYDLLDPSHETKGLEDLPKVTLQEDHDGRIHLRNLSAQLARNEEEALNLLFVGDTNRMISETPMNMASSRSHCIFTISIEARPSGSDVVRRSKLHLVDLAGSERVKKTGIEGTVLREARYINLSLHYLEQVIVALQEKKFVPYRNSMMTSVLRDSLGGNCKTVMVATLSSEEAFLDESVSTARFAQRVALVSNRLEVNEELDPKLLVARLKAEVRELKEEIQLLRGDGYERAVDALTADERVRCEELVEAWLREAAANPQATLNPGEMAKIQFCFRVLRERGGRGGGGDGGGGGGAMMGATAPTGGGGGGGGSSADAEELSRLRMQLQQRDHEINILVSMLNKHGHAAPPGSFAASIAASAGAGGLTPLPPLPPRGGVHAAGAGHAYASAAAAAMPPPVSAAELVAKREHVALVVEKVGASGTEEAEALLQRNAAFEAFRRSYRKNEVIEENKLLLKQKYDEAKALGEAVNGTRAQINQLKGQIEALRQKQAAAGLAEDADDSAGESVEEQALRAKMEEGKRSYKEGFAKLKELKAEIEHLQHLLEQSRRKLQSDFEAWYAKQQLCAGAGPLASAPPGGAVAPPGASPHRVPAPPPAQAWSSPGRGGGGGVPYPPPPPAGARGAAGGGAGPTLTGQPDVDKEILAFYEARDLLVKQRMAGGAKK